MTREDPAGELPARSLIVPGTVAPDEPPPRSWKFWRWSCWGGPRWKSWRWYARVVTLLAALAVAGYGGREVGRLSRAEGEIQKTVAATGLAALPYTEPVKQAVAQKLESSRGLFQASLLVIAVLWGLVLAKKGETKLGPGDYPELVMFAAANALLAAGWYAHSKYLDAMAAAHSRDRLYREPAKLTIIDFTAEGIELFFVIQQNLWVCGVVATALVLVSFHILKEEPPS